MRAWIRARSGSTLPDRDLRPAPAAPNVRRTMRIIPRISLSLSLATGLALTLAAPAARADLELPRPSPGAKVTQEVGLTQITVDYSCPGVKGRKVWGELVPYDKLWRTGANSATKVTFSKDVTFVDKPVP